jgi:hypothetical protein
VISRQVETPAGSEITENKENLDSFRFNQNRNESKFHVAQSGLAGSGIDGVTNAF